VLTHLIPLGRDRFDLYSEAPEPEDDGLAHDAGPVRRWLRAAGEQWRSYVDRARLGEGVGTLEQWRDAIISRLADSLDEQRTLRSLRTTASAELLYPATLGEAAARAVLMRLLRDASRAHGRRLVMYLLLFVASGILFFVPGPNIVAYYLGFQAFGHLQAWRGARHAAREVRWNLVPSTDLAELSGLTSQPHAQRADAVTAVAERLGLEHLAAFFERAAA